MMTARPVNMRAENGLPLVYLPIDDISSTLGFGIASLSGLRRSRVAEAFIEYCHEVVAERGLPGCNLYRDASVFLKQGCGKHDFDRSEKWAI